MASTKRRANGQKIPLTEDQISTLENLLFYQERFEELAMFRVGIDTMLRGTDVCQIYTREIQDADGNIKEESTVMQKKTGNSVSFAITKKTTKALLKWLEVRDGDFRGPWLFPGRKPGTHITYKTYLRRTKAWAKMINIDVDKIGTHSMRRTKASIMFEKNKDPDEVRELLGHASLESTRYYLGGSRKKALAAAKKLEI